MAPDNQDDTRPMSLIIASKAQRPSGVKELKYLRVEPEDLVAFGVLALTIGAVLVAVIVGVFWGLGRIEGNIAGWVITGCVGGAAISGVVLALVKKSKGRRP